MKKNYNISSGKKWEILENNFLAKFMLIGEYTHTIDEKNRISLPAKFRKEMGKSVVLTPGLDQCLFIFSMKEWQKVVKKLSGKDGELSFLSSDQRSFNRIMFGQAVDQEVDKIGRILLPDFLKSKIRVSAKAVMVGVEDRVEIWNERAWEEFKKKSEQEAERLAEKLARGNDKQYE